MPSLDFELSAVDCVRAELFLDTEELVVFRDAVGAAEGTGLDLATVGRNRDISDGGVFGFTGTVGEDGGIAGFLGHFNRVEGLGEGTDLIDLNKDGVGGFGFDALLEELGIRYEEVITDELGLMADRIG